MTFGFEIDHVQIAIPKGSEDQARAFFGELLGLEELPKPADMAARGGCWFAASDRQIHLGVETDFRPAKKAHVALNTDGLDALRLLLEQAGYTTQDDSDVDGRKRFFTHDPFGNRIEFMDRTART
jgi:catechol 2,3-dioxygenase-like lactoylglutathione lyase family enzyme